CCTGWTTNPWPVCLMTPPRNSPPPSGGRRAWKAPWRSCKSVSQSGQATTPNQQPQAVDRLKSMSAGTNKVSGSAAGGEGLRKISEAMDGRSRSEEHTSELQSREKLVCRLLL